MAYKTIDDMAEALGGLKGKTALVRVDLNVPMQDGRVSDTTRLEATRETVDLLCSFGARVVLLAHFGRPKGKVVADQSLKAVVPALSVVLEQLVGFINHGESMPDTDDTKVFVLENTRFLPGEETDDPATAAQFAALGDVYVNDAFSAAHRAHASTHGIAKLLPSAPGCTMARELAALDAALGAPERPVTAVVGGAKVSSKIDVLKNLVEKVDNLIIGGGMANTFLFARGVGVGASLCEKDLVGTVKDIEAAAEAAGCTIHLPVDIVLTKEFRMHAPHRVSGLEGVLEDEMILDAGPATIAALVDVLKNTKTLVWNGPLGAFELEPFDTATNGLARAAAMRTKLGQLLTVAGGGDTVAALAHAGVKEGFTHISTAGGAFLEWMEGRALPGVDALK